MRNPDRLDNFYAEFCELHKKYLPDWRFGQFMYNFFSSFNCDPFFIEDDQMIKMIREYVSSIIGEEI